MKKTIAFTFLLFVLHFPFVSCNEEEKIIDPCGGGLSEPAKSIIKEIGAKSGFVYPSDFTQSDSIKGFQKSAIELEVKSITLIYPKQATTLNYKFKRFSFMNFAMACSPRIIPTQKIKKVVISSNKEVFLKNLKFEANQDLTEYFLIDNYYSEPVPIKSLNSHIFGNEREKLYFKLNQEPIQSIENHDITITLTMDDGEVYKAVAKGFNVEV